MKHENIQSIQCKRDLAAFLQDLQKDYESNGDEWNNQSIGAYLEAIRAWLNDSQDPAVDSACWRYIAALLLAGKMYE